MMRRYAAWVLAGLLLVFVSLSLYQYQVNRTHHEHIDSLINVCIADAKDSFSDYLRSPSRESYLFAVSSFHTFTKLYPESSYYDSEFFRVISQAYAKLLFDASLDEDNLQTLVEALEFWEKDCSDIRGCTSLQTFLSA